MSGEVLLAGAELSVETAVLCGIELPIVLLVLVLVLTLVVVVAVGSIAVVVVTVREAEVKVGVAVGVEVEVDKPFSSTVVAGALVVAKPDVETVRLPMDELEIDVEDEVVALASTIGPLDGGAVKLYVGLETGNPEATPEGT